MHLNVVFSPTPYGFKYPSKSPVYNTIIHTPFAQIGEIRVSSSLYPLWDITFDLEWARGAENLPSTVYNYLLGFFMSVGGQLSDFLYLDPNDNAAASQAFGIGDGTTTEFQLVRAINVGYDIVQNLNGAPAIYNNGTLVSGAAYTISSTGIVVFTVAPIAGHVLTWTGSFYYRCRFLNPEQRFDQFAQQIWTSKNLTLRSVILGSVLS